MEQQQFETVIDNQPQTLASLASIRKYRDLIFLFVKRNFVIAYKQTILGPLWIVISPLVTSVIFTFIFGQLAGIDTDGTPQFLFYLAGTTLWGLFSSCITSTANSFTANSGIFSKVYFPRLVLPVAQTITCYLNFFIQLAFFVVFYIYFWATGSPIALNAYALLIPLVLIQVGIMGAACGLIVSSLTTKYRDLAVAVSLGVQLWMYITPVVYPFSSLGGLTKTLVQFNPMTFPLELFRYGLMGAGTVNLWLWLLSWGVTLALVLLAAHLFAKIERTFIDTI